MKLRSRFAGYLILIIVLFSLAACSSSSEGSGDIGGDTLDLIEESSGERVPAASNRPAWQKITLYDLRTSTSFSLADFTGKVVVLELMTIDCSGCDRQAGEIREVLEGQGETVVAISLAIAPDEDHEKIIEHSDDIDRTWPISYIGPDFAIALMQEFGESILDESGSPVMIISPTGRVTVMPAGVAQANTLEAAVTKVLP